MEELEWNEQVKRFSPAFGGFLQSYAWGAFQESLGRTVIRIFKESEKGTLVAQAVAMPLPFGKRYFFIPKGPLGDMEESEMLKVLKEELGSAMFYRIEPSKPVRLPKIADVHPNTTSIIDLTKGREEYLAGMKKRTRYNITLAQKKGVESRFVGLDHLEDFFRLLAQTTTRNNIRSNTRDYYKSMLERFQGGGVTTQLAMAFYEGHPIAGNIVVDFQGERTYLHGATSNLHRNVMAQYHLHDFLIEDAMTAGMHSFDFWGVAPLGSDESHPWAGISRYKLGYGGAIIEANGTVDVQIEHFTYAVYQFLRTARRTLNGSRH